MIINKLEETNAYQIKIIGQTIDIYNPTELEKITKKIFQKIGWKNKINNIVFLDFYIDNQYGIIILIDSYHSYFNFKDEIEVKITIHNDIPFLYQVDYFTPNEINLKNYNIYYYNNKYYLELKNKINTKDYLNLLESSQPIYKDTSEIIDKGIKL